MAGLINVGTDYKNRALSGFVRESAEQERIDVANEQTEAERHIQTARLGAEGAIAGGIGGYMFGTSSMFAGTEMGAELGAWGGPLGIVAGGGLGFLFSKLF